MAIKIRLNGGGEFTCNIFDQAGLDSAINDYLNDKKDSLWCCEESASIGSGITRHCVLVSKLAGYSVTPKTAPDGDDDDQKPTRPDVFTKPKAPDTGPSAPVTG